MRGSAETLKKITLELGGKSPNIVFPDADLDAAIRGATTGIFYGKGEVCAAGSRLLVDKSIKSEFIDKVAARAKKMAPGDPLDPKTRLGAISSKKQLENRSPLHRDWRRRKARRCVAGGGRADIGTGKGYFLQPTVFDGVTPEMTIAREEIFGPVLAAIEFGDVDEAIARANDSTTASPPRSGRRTSRRRTTSRASSRRARSGSTPTTSTTRRRRSAATSRAASAAR